MTSYVAIPNGDIDQDSPVTQPLMTALRDNPIAIAEGDNTAPVNQTAWHPYNKVTVNDANTGIIYNFPTDGAVATVTSPDFQDGYEYAFMFDLILGTVSIATLQIDWYRETSAAYSGSTAVNGFPNSSTSAPMSGFIALPFVRVARRYHTAIGEGFSGTTNSFASIPTTIVLSGNAVGDPTSVEGIRHAASQKILRVRFSYDSGNITGSGSTGKITMYRRRVFA